MKYMMLLRKWGLRGHIQKWLSLPNTAGQGAKNSWEAGLFTGQQLLFSCSRPCLVQPPAPNTHSSKAQFLLPTRLSGHRNRWQMAKGAREYKRSPIPSWSESTARPGTAPLAQPEEPGLGLQLLRRLECAFLSQKSSSGRPGCVTLGVLEPSESSAGDKPALRPAGTPSARA